MYLPSNRIWENSDQLIFHSCAQRDWLQLPDRLRQNTVSPLLTCGFTWILLVRNPSRFTFSFITPQRLNINMTASHGRGATTFYLVSLREMSIGLRPHPTHISNHTHSHTWGTLRLTIQVWPIWHEWPYQKDCFSQHSPNHHRCTQAPPRQGGDPWRGVDRDSGYLVNPFMHVTN